MENKRTQLLILIMILLFFFVEIIIIYQLTSEYKLRQSLDNANSSKAQNDIFIQSLIKQFGDDQATLDKAILTESQFPEIIDKINNRISQYPDSSFKFDSNESVLVPNSQFGYFLVTINAVVPSIEEANLLIKDLSYNSFLYTVQDAEFNRRPDNQTIKIIIKGRLYVQKNN